MKLSKIFAIATVLATPAAAIAQDVTTTGYVGVATDYVWRGVSQSSGELSPYAGVDVASGPFYLGAWLGGVDFGGDANLETDLYASYKPTIGPFAMEFGLLAYLYPQETNLNTIEGKVAATYTTKTNTGVTGSVYYSPNVASTKLMSAYYEVGVSQPLSNMGSFATALGASFGKYDTEDTADYTNVKVYFSATSDKGWGFELGATDTNKEEDTLADARGYISVKKMF